jgi:hypothetical protein
MRGREGSTCVRGEAKAGEAATVAAGVAGSGLPYYRVTARKAKQFANILSYFY